MLLTLIALNLMTHDKHKNLEDCSESSMSVFICIMFHKQWCDGYCSDI